MIRTCRYKNLDRVNRLVLALLALVFVLTGCAVPFVNAQEEESKTPESAILTESASDSFVYFPDLKAENSDIFAWIYVPGTSIDYPILQNGDGDDSFYLSHNALKQEDKNGALFIEAANMANMCDFNEVVHGKTLTEGGMFSDLNRFLDRTFFEENQYIYLYMEGNVLVYVIMAAYQRPNTRLLAEYDFSYAYGCQEFIDEIYSGKTMGKNLRAGWDKGLAPENFIITLSTVDEVGTGRQTVVIGCLAADMNDQIDRVIDYSRPE